MLVAIVFFVYGAVTLVDAVIAYRKSGSRNSLAAGVISGTILDASGALVLLGISVGASIGLGTTLALLGIFASRYMKTKVFMPSGLMLAVTVVATAILFTELFP